MSYRDWARTALIAVFVAVIVVASSGMGFAAGWYLSLRAKPSPTPSPAGDDIQARFGLFWEAFDIIQREYSGPIDVPKLVHGAIDGAVRSLGDPYTAFSEPEQARILEQDLEGSFEGIGATVDVLDGQMVVVEPLEGSPAAKAGLRAGDILLEADGKPLQGLDFSQALVLIRGPKGSQVRLLVRREGVADPFEVVVTRDTIDVPTVSYRMLDGGIAYVRLTEFNSRAGTRLRASLREALAHKPQAVILDLRGNPGGYLHIAVQVANEFIRDGVLVTERDGKDKVTEYKAEGNGLVLDLPLAVLVDRGSASAAEIVAAAIQDTGRGVLIGQPTFGKGSVQVAHTLSDGSSLRVTVAHWYSPKGYRLDGQGLTPEVVVPADQAAGGDPVLDRAVQYLKSPQAAPAVRM